MTTLPAFVTRLLDDLGQRHLAGDLAEELHAGRSSAWVWWQVTAAVCSAVSALVRWEPFLAFRAGAVGWIALQIVSGRLPFSPHPEFMWWVMRSSFSIPIIAAQYFVTGWLVARSHPRHRVESAVVAGVVLMVTNAAFFTFRTILLIRSPAFASSPIQFSDVPFLLLPLFATVGGLWAPGIARQPKPVRG